MEIGEQEDLPPCISISSQSTNKDDEDYADGVCTETVEDDVTTNYYTNSDNVHSA
ncbi:hypothetical protein J6590_090405, partial [Homalodisca vitripennis]